MDKHVNGAMIHDLRLTKLGDYRGRSTASSHGSSKFSAQPVRDTPKAESVTVPVTCAISKPMQIPRSHNPQ